MKEKKAKEYGILLRHELNYGTHYVVAEIVERVTKNGKIHPLNPSQSPWDDEEPRHLRGMLLAGLKIRGFISDIDGFPYIGFSPQYYNLYNVDLQTAGRMVKTLRHIEKRFHDSEFTGSPEIDHFINLCDALKLSFVVEQIEGSHGGSYADGRWNWMSISEGRIRFREMIYEKRTELTAARKGDPK